MSAPTRRIRIIPAYAGSTRAPARIPHLIQDHPRIRGEHTLRLLYIQSSLGSSPHTRGAPNAASTTNPYFRIIPAYAGGTPPTWQGCISRLDHPRIRGEHWSRLPTMPRPVGSSPHTRGAPESRGRLARKRGIIPAYAGSTRILGSRPARRPDHPRIRGEHWFGLGGAADRGGSSPHTRGARILADPVSGPGRIIPAYAGSTVTFLLRRYWPEDHPRIRGEHFRPGPTPSRTSGSSPHTRGAHTHTLISASNPRIIPAYAGSTSRTTTRASAPSDHPRIRGEHADIIIFRSIAAGSSPHTRGARGAAEAAPHM